LNDSLVSNENSPRIVIDNDTIIPTFHRIKLRATSELGCDATLQYESRIAVLPRPTASFRMKQQSVNKFDPVVDFVNSSANGVRWYWDFGDGNTSDEFAPSHTYLNSGKYPVYQVAWNTFNCPDTAFSPSWSDYNKTTKDRAWRLIVDPVTTLYIPNSFTPNGDGINDVWSLKGFNEGRPFEIEVFNRWGELMFESNEMNVEWDGIMPNSNKYAPNTTYVYVIRYQTSSGEEKEETGTFSLIR
jgi:gliding motility-associated-like protein